MLLVGFSFRKMIPAKTWNKIHNQKLLAIIEVFKSWRYYLEGCKYKVFVLINHNNLCHFIVTKSPNLRQIY